MMYYNTKETNALLRNRRSSYPSQFDPIVRTIPKKIVEEILINATHAPNHGKTEPWHFVVFGGDGRRKLGEFQAKLYKELAEKEGNFDENKFIKLLESPLKASHVIAIGMKRQESGKIPEIEEISAVACAVQNIYLSATAYGLGGYWGSGGITYAPEAKSFFGLGENDQLMGFFYLAFVVKASPEYVRKPISEKVTWVE